MNKPSITTSEAARALRILQEADSPIVAAGLAAALGLAGNRETQRRHVRAIIEHLRADGSMIVATLQQGYWLTCDAALWRDYLEGRQIDAKRILGETGKRKKMLSDAKGQGMLFEQRIQMGCATCGIG